MSIVTKESNPELYNALFLEDEIKEILDRARNLKNKCSCCEQIADNVYVSRYHEIETQNLAEAVYLIDKLLDYITNLQEEIEKLTAESTEWESKFYDLQEELKEYKMLFDAFSERPYAHRYLEEKKKELGNKNIIGLDSEMIYKDYYDLKEENERLKEQAKKDNHILGCNFAQKNKYKSRNEKAIECIKDKYYKEEYERKGTFTNKLMNILQGKDK